MTTKQRATKKITKAQKIFAIWFYSIFFGSMFVGCAAIIASDDSSTTNYSNEDQIRKDAITICKAVVSDPWNCNESNF